MTLAAKTDQKKRWRCCSKSMLMSSTHRNITLAGTAVHCTCREQILARKRREYQDMVPEYYDIANNNRSEEEVGALRQVSVDVPRTAPGVAFFHEAPVQKCLERILYLWGIR